MCTDIDSRYMCEFSWEYSGVTGCISHGIHSWKGYGVVPFILVCVYYYTGIEGELISLIHVSELALLEYLSRRSRGSCDEHLTLYLSLHVDGYGA